MGAALLKYSNSLRKYFSLSAQLQWLWCLLLIFVCTFTCINTAHSGKQEDLENLRKRITTMQREMEKTSESKSEAADALRESEKAISSINRELIELTTKLRAADKQLSNLEIEQQKLQSDMVHHQALLGKLLTQQHLGGKVEYPKLILNNQDPNQIARDLQYYRYIARSRANLLAKLREDAVKIDKISKAAHTQRLKLNHLGIELTAQKTALDKQQRVRQQVLSKISKQLRQQRHEINRLQRDENRLARLVEKITALLSQPESNSSFSNNILPDNRFDSSPFKKLKGKLRLPVKGKITNRFGDRRPESTVKWKGWFVRTSSGQTVKSIASGQVVFADWLRGFGNLLIVDHGKGYMSLYGNNESLYKQVGDILRGGDTIAIVGNSGGNEFSGLYFELRHKSKPLDPEEWLTVK